MCLGVRVARFFRPKLVTDEFTQPPSTLPHPIHRTLRRCRKIKHDRTFSLRPYFRDFVHFFTKMSTRSQMKSRIMLHLCVPSMRAGNGVRQASGWLCQLVSAEFRLLRRVQTWTRQRVRVDEFRDELPILFNPSQRQLVNIRISPLYDRNVNYK